MFDSVKAGREIAVLRKKQGLTQEELADRLHISPQAVSVVVKLFCNICG